MTEAASDRALHAETGEGGEPVGAEGVVTIVGADPTALLRLCGLTLLERNLRALARAGVEEVTVLTRSPRVRKEAERRHWSRASLRVRTAPPAFAAEAERVTLAELRVRSGGRTLLYVPAAIVCDTRLYQALLRATGSTALVDSAPPSTLQPLVARAVPTPRGHLVGPCRLDRGFLESQPASAWLGQVLPAAVESGELLPLDVAQEPSYAASLRRTLRPLWFPAPGLARLRDAEAALVATAQKGALDVPAMLHAPIENAIVARLCRTSVTPNQLTLFSAAVAWIATVLFAAGHLGAGLAVALAVGVLDGLDGKQARLKLETSRLGELEHFSDFAFELSWWTALAWHFSRTGALSWAGLVLLALYLAEAADGLVKLVAIRRLGVLIDEAAPSMRLVRLLGGRRNIYVWIMVVGWIVGAPAAAFALLPIWQGATFALHLVWALANLGRFRSPGRAGAALEAACSNV